MENVEVVRHYVKAWNGRDPEGVLAVFAEGGTYEDPTTQGPVSGQAIVDMVSGLLAMLPDLSFEIVDLGPVAGTSKVMLQWLMRGTNTGPLRGGPPLGHSVAVPGVDIITVAGDKVARVRGYFDVQTTFAQLGLRAEPQPAEPLGPFIFGTCVYAWMGSLAKPGAISLTAIEVRDRADQQAIKDQSRLISTELLGMPGFIGWLGMVTDDRMFTVTAWEDADGPSRLRSHGQHSEAVRAFFNGDLGGSGTLSVWVPERIKQHIPCPECGKYGEASRGTCRNGHSLPPERYF